MSLFVFKNLFLRRDLFMISLFIFLFMKGAWFARTYCFLWEQVLNSFMKSCFKYIKIKIFVLRSYFMKIWQPCFYCLKILKAF